MSSKDYDELFDRIPHKNKSILEPKEIADYIFMLEKELKSKLDDISMLTSRISKAIEYIKENEFYLDYKTGACIKGVMPLLNILQNESDDNE